jgi:hypothetical protein
MRVSYRRYTAFLNVAPHNVWITDIKTNYLEPLYFADYVNIYAELTDL